MFHVSINVTALGCQLLIPKIGSQYLLVLV